MSVSLFYIVVPPLDIPWGLRFWLSNWNKKPPSLTEGEYWGGLIQSVTIVDLLGINPHRYQAVDGILLGNSILHLPIHLP